jgi:hypothetical protein
MDTKESRCSLNLRRFPLELRRRLHAFAVLRGEQVQEIIPRWIKERLDQEESKNQLGKPIAKPKSK